jgi:dTDP-4-amino-4,6-dideoxygalactose transaminase
LLALCAAGVQSGDEVILCSHTMIATAAAVHFAGAVPIPVECSSDHLLDPAAVEAAVTRRTRAVIPTQLNGRCCNMLELGAIAEKHGLLIVEDAAQAFGAKFKGRCAGTFGDVGVFSFYPAKALGCLGDGGAVIANDPRVYYRLRRLRDHGRDSQGEVVSWGFNSRLDNLQAAILDSQLKSYETVVARRRAVASLYTERLQDLADVVLPPAPGSESDHFDIFQNYEIEAERRDQLKQYLRERGIGTLIPWGGRAIHQLKNLDFTQRLPHTDWLFTRLLMLPMNMSMSDQDVQHVCDHIRAFYGR